MTHVAVVPDTPSSFLLRPASGVPAAAAVTIVPPLAVTGLSAGSRPATVAVFTIVPAATSVAVTVYVAVHVIVAPGVSEAPWAGVHESGERPTIGSSTVT